MSLTIDNYDVIRLDRAWKEPTKPTVEKGGGVAAFIKSEISYSTTNLSDHNISCQYIEILWISINLPNQKKKVLGIVYRPPKAKVQPFIEILIKSTTEIMSINDNEIFIVGDFNINYAATTNKDRKLLKEFEAMTGLKQIIDQPTRYARNNTTIDLIFTNSEHISNHGTLNLNISDHEIIYISRKKKKEQFNLIKTIGRSYLSYNRELFQSQLINANWDAFQHISDVNLYWTNLENIIRETIDKMCPLRKMNIKDRGDPWMTNELIRKIRDKDYLRKIAKRSGDEQDWRLAKQARNEVKHALNKAKSDFIKGSITTHAKDNKKNLETNKSSST